MSAGLCPECAAGKHYNCDGTSWDFETETSTECPCDVGICSGSKGATL